MRRLQQLQEQQLLVFLFHGSTLICCSALAKDAIAVLLLVTAACHSARLSLPRCTNPARNRHLHLSAGLEAALTALHSPASHLLLLLSSLRRGRGSHSASVHLPPDPVSRLTYRTHPRERSLPADAHRLLPVCSRSAAPAHCSHEHGRCLLLQYSVEACSGREGSQFSQETLPVH